jgi:hypothetical protein
MGDILADPSRSPGSSVAERAICARARRTYENAPMKLVPVARYFMKL